MCQTVGLEARSGGRPCVDRFSWTSRPAECSRVPLRTLTACVGHRVSCGVFRLPLRLLRTAFTLPVGLSAAVSKARLVLALRGSWHVASLRFEFFVLHPAVRIATSRLTLSGFVFISKVKTQYPERKRATTTTTIISWEGRSDIPPARGHTADTDPTPTLWEEYASSQRMPRHLPNPAFPPYSIKTPHCMAPRRWMIHSSAGRLRIGKRHTKTCIDFLSVSSVLLW